MTVASLTRSRAAQMLARGQCDLVGFGQAYIFNPDLVERFRHGWPLNRPDIATYYTQWTAGYTDYPRYAESLCDDLLDVDAALSAVSDEVTG